MVHFPRLDENIFFVFSRAGALASPRPVRFLVEVPVRLRTALVTYKTGSG